MILPRAAALRQGLDWIETGLAGESLGKRGDAAVRQIEFHALQAVHGEEHDAGSKGLAVFDDRDQIFERCQLDTAKAEAFRRKRQDRSPEFFSRVAQCGHDHCPRAKRSAFEMTGGGGRFGTHNAIVAGTEAVLQIGGRCPLHLDETRPQTPQVPRRVYNLSAS